MGAEVKEIGIMQSTTLKIVDENTIKIKNVLVKVEGWGCGEEEGNLEL